jgi:hypothetical protein
MVIGLWSFVLGLPGTGDSELPIGNPYKLLRVPRSADEATIDEAYNELYDEYEPQARDGDEDAIAMLEELNEARDILMNPRRRAALDARMSGRGVATEERLGRGSRDSYRNGKQRDTAYGRRTSASQRPRSVQAERRLPVVPIALSLVAVAAVVVAALFVVARVTAKPVPTDMGPVVATVNGEPIYEVEYNERVERDRQNALSDPFFAAMADNFQGITGTRMLDVLKYDALDKLINLEVIKLEARQEGSYPSEQQQVDLVEQAKASDLMGRTFEDFLIDKGITEEQYKRSVIKNVVYAVMASKHMPQEGDEDSRVNAFLAWMCEKRENYVVEINIQFQVEGNQPCSSGLPSDVPITGDLPAAPGGEEPIVPEAEPTGEIPLGPVFTPTPAAP